MQHDMRTVLTRAMYKTLYQKLYIYIYIYICTIVQQYRTNRLYAINSLLRNQNLPYPSKLILLTWNIDCATNNTRKWQLRFKSAFKGLRVKNVFKASAGTKRYLEQQGHKESRLYCIYNRMVLKDFMLGLLGCIM